MTVGRIRLSILVVAALPVVSGCMTNAVGTGQADGGGGDGQTDLASEAAAKAVDVAGLVGGADGFGGEQMDGYIGHSPSQMGFHGQSDLASPTGGMMVRVRNESEQDGTFQLTYFASHMGLDDQMMEVEVAQGDEVVVDLPCAEIVGMGSLDTPGSVGCFLESGQEIDNLMAVPGFLGLDYECGAAHEFVLTPDVDDLDGDGDTEELIILSDAMQTHMTDGGPTGHMHGDGTGAGMMGSHMGG